MNFHEWALYSSGFREKNWFRILNVAYSYHPDSTVLVIQLLFNLCFYAKLLLVFNDLVSFKMYCSWASEEVEFLLEDSIAIMMVSY